MAEPEGDAAVKRMFELKEELVLASVGLRAELKQFNAQRDIKPEVEVDNMSISDLVKHVNMLIRYRR